MSGRAGPVLVTGATGFLGWPLAEALRAAGQEVLGTSRDGRGLPPGVEPLALELEDGGQAGAELIRRRRPGAVLHLAGLSDADACAADPARAERLNALASARLAGAAAEAGAWLLYASTDLVFGGDAAPYAEEDPPAPLGPYMASKVAGEAAVRAAHPGALVARIALVYGLGRGRGRSFTDRVVARLEAGEPVDLFLDQHRTPILLADLVRALVDLTALAPRGVLHLAGPERVSRLEHGLALAAALGRDPALCRGLRMADAPGLSPRPADVSLRTGRLGALLGWTPRGVSAGCEALALERAGR